jgi:apolipoprotein N-acyltransferase
MKPSALRWNSFLFLSGAIGALSLPPFGLWLLFLLPMTMAIIRLDHCETIKQAFLSGWCLGFGYFLAGLWWIGTAFLVESQFIWAMPFAIVGLPAVLSFFFAMAFALSFYFWQPGFARILIFSLTLTTTELLRGEVLSGFPWNAVGMVLGSSLELSQIASIFGLQGLNFLVVFLFSLPALFFSERKKAFRLSGPFVFVIGLTSLYFFGCQRLNAPQSDVVAGVRIRIMQPAVAQDEKFDKEYSARILTNYLSLSSRGSYPAADGMNGITHLIWPETAFPFLLDHSPKAREEISRILPKGAVLLTGAVRAEDIPDKSGRFYFNSIQVLDDSGAITASADKVHLVPFGEYLPFEGMIDFFGLRDFITAPGGFVAAEKRKSLAVPSWPLTLPLICYEAIFPEQIHLANGERPGVLLNVTNDAWFGLTPGPYQHFAQARLRAIEQGIPLIRAANNGISAIIDPYGRERGRIELGERGIVDGDLPTALPETVYSRIAGGPLSALSLFMGLIGVLFTLGQITPRRVSSISATSDR